MLNLPNHQTKSDLIVDYVLGLLDSAESQALEQHAATCANCRNAIESERLLTQRIRGTVNTLPRGSQARLASLMPQTPVSRQREQAGIWLRWQNGLAAVALIVALFVGNISFHHNSAESAENNSALPALVGNTATATQPPTATPTELAQATGTPLATPDPEFYSR